MNVFTNEKTIRRKGKIGNYASLAGTGLLLFTAYFIFRLGDPQFAKDNPNYSWLMLLIMIVGFALVQAGTHYMNRFGRSPRPDEALTATLKGLTKDYTLYHYLTPVNHLLVGPAGVWVIECYYQRGQISYKGGRWQQKGGGFFVAYMKIFGQEGLGRPDLDVKADTESLSDALKKVLGDDTPPINVALVFTNNQAEVAADNAPNPTLKLKDLKDYLRKYAKTNP
ncbi:MAG: NERD domain-containing protein, partial [Anaerolineales bacterium]